MKYMPYGTDEDGAEQRSILDIDLVDLQKDLDYSFYLLEMERDYINYESFKKELRELHEFESLFY